MAFTFEGLTPVELKDAVDYARLHGWQEPQALQAVSHALQGVCLTPHEADKIKAMVDARTRRIAA